MHEDVTFIPKRSSLQNRQSQELINNATSAWLIELWMNETIAIIFLQQYEQTKIVFLLFPLVLNNRNMQELNLFSLLLVFFLLNFRFFYFLFFLIHKEMTNLCVH